MPEHGPWGGLVDQFRHRVRDVLVAADQGLEPWHQQLQSARAESKRAADAVAEPVKADIRGGLHAANDALNPVSEQLKATEKVSKVAAGHAERFAKESGLEDTANAVQIVEGGVGLWKGGAKLAQVLKNPETREALLKLAKQPKDAWDVAKEMNARTSAFRAGQVEKTAEAARLQNMSEDAGQFRAMKDANRMLQGINPDGGRTNCQSAVIAAYHRYHGMGDVVIPKHAAPDVGYLESLFNGQFQQTASAHAVADGLKASGPGSSGVMWFYDHSGQTNHVVYAANVDGHVVFMDGQLGIASRASEYEGMAGYRFLPTPPPPGVKPVLPYPEPPLGGGGQPPIPPPPGGPHPPGGGPPPSGMRPQDRDVFKQAAADHDRWLLVRHTNPESLPYIGKEGYTPKAIDCKAKSADVPGHPHAGLVVDPHIHSTAYKDPAAAQKQWDAMHADLPKGYNVDTDVHSPRYGCLQKDGKYIHADYDMYDIVDPKRPEANLALVSEMSGQPHYQGPKLPKVGGDINSKIGTDMVQHGGEAQYKGHTDQRVMVFPPGKEPYELSRKAELEKLYAEQFNGRRALDHSNPHVPPPDAAGPLGVYVDGKFYPRKPGPEPSPTPGSVPKKDAGQDANLQTANRVAEGRDVETGKRPVFFRSSVNGANEEDRRRNAAEFAERKQREAAEQQERLNKIAQEKQQREAEAERKFQRDVKEGEKKEAAEKKEDKAEDKHDKQEHKKADEKQAEEKKKEQEDPRRPGSQKANEEEQKREADKQGDQKGAPKSDQDKTADQKAAPKSDQDKTADQKGTTKAESERTANPSTGTPSASAPPPRQQNNPSTSTPSASAPPPRQQNNASASSPSTSAPPQRQQNNPSASSPSASAPPPRQQNNASASSPSASAPPPRQQNTPSASSPNASAPPPRQQNNPSAGSPNTSAPPPRQQNNPSASSTSTSAPPPRQQNNPSAGSPSPSAPPPRPQPNAASGNNAPPPRPQPNASSGTNAPPPRPQANPSSGNNTPPPRQAPGTGNGPAPPSQPPPPNSPPPRSK